PAGQPRPRPKRAQRAERRNAPGGPWLPGTAEHPSAHRADDHEDPEHGPAGAPADAEAGASAPRPPRSAHADGPSAPRGRARGHR
ncbi:hypothetical protein R0J91_18865, partial [Micrococcus sp. SIMBA_131]